MCWHRDKERQQAAGACSPESRLCGLRCGLSTDAIGIHIEWSFHLTVYQKVRVWTCVTERGCGFMRKGVCDRKGALWALKSAGYGAPCCSESDWRRTAHRSPLVWFQVRLYLLSFSVPLDEPWASEYGGDQRQEKRWPGGTDCFYKSCDFCRSVFVDPFGFNFLNQLAVWLFL